MFAIELASRTKNYEILDILLEIVDVNSRCARNTPLHFAVILGDAEVVYRMIRHGADPSRPNTHGNTPLCEALLCNLAEIAEIMIRCTQHPIITKYDDEYLELMGEKITLTQLVFKILPDIDCYRPSRGDDHYDYIKAIGDRDDEKFAKALAKMSKVELVDDYIWIMDKLKTRNMKKSQELLAETMQSFVTKTYHCAPVPPCVTQ